MILKVTYLKASLLLLFFCLSLFSFAQTKDGDKNLLQGKWVLENLSVVEIKDSGYTKINKSGDVDIFSEMEIKQDTIIIVHNGKILKGEYKFYDTNLSFETLPLPFNTGWYLFENKLHLQQDVIDPDGKSPKKIVSFILKQNNL
ncbi:hypothetical protein IR083_02140 [Dysgonomonas sp. GY75]|uniref:hypothetical protein n=1 Tax=Dysgonomonas sp. GY75 TaxID=2780419 RepID=UPI00188388E8|nr:hypothetical protein [Dysgonomonas sp. GY75]MBF0647617.1 hypothetical protein [Dysgonomonas sp. GY75]